MGSIIWLSTTAFPTVRERRRAMNERAKLQKRSPGGKVGDQIRYIVGAALKKCQLHENLCHSTDCAFTNNVPHGRESCLFFETGCTSRTGLKRVFW